MKQIVIKNFSTNYYITKDGKCYNNLTNKYLKGQINKNGYLTYYLTLPDGKKTRQYAHRLVAQAYLQNPNTKKKEINHIDGNKLNNCIDNLEWITSKENQLHALNNEFHVFCFNREKVLIAEYLNIKEASDAVHISRSIICQELNKQIKTLCGGFYWSKEKTLGETKNYSNLGKAKEVYQYTLDGKFITSYSSTGIAAKAIGVKNSSHIGECCRGKIKSYKGFIFRYKEDIVSTSNEN